MGSHSQKVREIAGKNEVISPKAAIYRVGGLEIDPSRAVVRRGGEIVELRPKTYRFLLYLLEHPDRLVTKEELVERVWDGTAVTDDVLGL